MMGELKIASLGSDFRTDQDAGALGFCEPSGITVTLKKGEFLMEECGFDLNASQKQRAKVWSWLLWTQSTSSSTSSGITPFCIEPSWIVLAYVEPYEP